MLLEKSQTSNSNLTTNTINSNLNLTTHSQPNHKKNYELNKSVTDIWLTKNRCIIEKQPFIKGRFPSDFGYFGHFQLIKILNAPKVLFECEGLIGTCHVNEKLDLSDEEMYDSEIYKTVRAWLNI